ncbi:hypothetical protein [Aureimonas leprariae]|uniref:Uncharacterized protein n=1 Tax=Plantimonas leprariae TaxID=2615207 RepID=A0A7V7TXV3_9HYPH|nr:hypothetical protein [Aureimonas leprariae]KAB0676197.1 hypothetical protein F6X38_21885 [Aureimonas leprariae]
MDRWTRLALSTLVTGSVASVVSAAALALLSRAEGRGAARPLNATSHWLYGEAAATRDEPDRAHTLVGTGTHHASSLFWALPFQLWLNRQPRRPFAALLRDATVMSAIAAAVDYGATPRRFTPGWELALSKRSMLAAYAALAIGLAVGVNMSETMFGTGRSGEA